MTMSMMMMLRLSFNRSSPILIQQSDDLLSECNCIYKCVPMLLDVGIEIPVKIDLNIHI